MTTSKERFIKTMNFTSVDRPPLFEDGIRDEVIRKWHHQGLGKKENINSLFAYDHREEIEPNLEPLPSPAHWPRSARGLKSYARLLDADDIGRLPDDWETKVCEWKNRDFPLILRIHRGYFLSIGVHGWRRFTQAAQLLVDQPRLIEEWMMIVSEFSAKLAEKILQHVTVDAALFSEPIGGNHGPLISPKMYSKFVINSYQPILNVLQRYGVTNIIYRTYANTRLLLPAVVDAGFTCLWACECNPQAMDYLNIRSEYGRNLRLIGGIDSDSLRQSQSSLYQMVVALVPRLLADGGYIPLADGRVREDVPYENYLFYRKLLESVTSPPIN